MRIATILYKQMENKTKMENNQKITVVPAQPQPATFKQNDHIENGFKCVLDKDHSDQQNYRDSVGVWFTVPALSKLQAKLGVNAKTVNQNSLVVEMARLIGVELKLEDLDRKRPVVKVQPVAVVEPVVAVVEPVAVIEPVVAVADTTPKDATAEWIAKQFQNGFTEQQIKTTLKDNSWTDENMAKYFKVEVAQVPPPPF